MLDVVSLKAKYELGAEDFVQTTDFVAPSCDNNPYFVGLASVVSATPFFLIPGELKRPGK